MIRAAIVLTVLFACALARAGAPGLQIASSALLVMDASIHKDDIVLHISRTANHTPIEGAGNVTARIGGQRVPITARGSAYVLSTKGLKGGAHKLRVIVAHDGIHELLRGTITLPKRATDRLGLLERHGYGAWWVLNIVVLLLAANLIMRRKKKPPAKKH